MADRILLKGSESQVPATAGAATSFSGATVVRFANKATGTDHTLTVKTAVGGSVVGTFTIMRSTSEVLEKNPTDVVHVDSGTAVVGTKVGFTN